MKRDINIVPLSRDHHHTLLFCWKIRQGMAKGTDPERIRPYILYFWKDHLEKHFQEEESLLFRDINSPLVLRAVEEHRRITDLISVIGGNGPNLPDSFRALADLVEDHVRFEERELFPFLEITLAKERLSEIGAGLNQLHDHSLKDMYKDAFWS